MLVFDGHNDLLSRLWQAQGDPVARFQSDEGHVNEKACAKGGFAGGFFAIYCPEKRAPTGDIFDEDGLTFVPLPDPLDPGWALRAAIGQAGIAHDLQSAGHVRIVTNAQDLAQSFVGDALACVLHLEGADPIDPDLLALETLYACLLYTSPSPRDS